MDLSKQWTGRQAAFWILQKVEEGAYVNLELSKILSQQRVLELDRGLLTELTYGCLKQKSWLDFFLQKWISRPLAQLDCPVLIALRLGLYQIHFMDRIPAHAAVSETVELVKESAPQTAGMVNAVLRRALEQSDWTVRSKKGKAGWLAITYSHPLWMIHRWLKRFGEEATEALLESNQETPTTFLRVNTLKILPKDLQQRLQERSVFLRNSEVLPECFILESPVQNIEPEIAQGLLVIQDIGAMVITRILQPQPEESILDYCSAPGGKTTHLAALMENRGIIMALELHEHRAELVRQAVQRSGASIVQVKQQDGTKHCEQLGTYDKILLDVPCSGTGVLRRKVDARWQKTYEQLVEIVALQRALMRQAYSYLKPGGTMIYSTCSLELEENEKNIEWFLQEEPTASLEPFQLPGPNQRVILDGFYTILPQEYDGDGFFIALLRKEN